MHNSTPCSLAVTHPITEVKKKKRIRPTPELNSLASCGHPSRDRRGSKLLNFRDWAFAMKDCFPKVLASEGTYFLTFDQKELPKMQYFSKFVTFFPTFSPLLGSNDSFFQAKTGTRLHHNLPHTWIVNFQLFLSPCNHVKSIFRANSATRIWVFFQFRQIFPPF